VLRRDGVLLDSGAVTFFASNSGRARSVGRALPGFAPMVLSITLAECLRGSPGDARTNRFLKDCTVVETVPESIARDAARIRTLASRGSAIDALMVAYAEGGTVITGDRDDFLALAAHIPDVTVVVI
jgi:predicted nucleic acid-binding protein